ncbi:MAG: adenosylcobinamide-GDP ribazoletransferase [Lachnospiraceae bacterium]|nr:adenosylcobinamide-GDP ribazoletransferase [Lachnospiraceae bacterium]
MSFIKSFLIAFSMYSKIPMPQFSWEDEDMQYILGFFPLIGGVIGVITIGWYWLCSYFGIGILCFTAIGAAIPVMISGGIHLDGFLDTMDALHSYQNKSRKLEILKDSHLGAFAVIELVLYYLIYVGCYSELSGTRAVLLLAGGYMLSRIFSSIGAVMLPNARGEGMLFLFSDKAKEKMVKAMLFIELICCAAFLIYNSKTGGFVLFAGSALTYVFYKRKSRKEFGGITGDTAGFFVTLCEGVQIVLIAGMCVINLC